jgi:hypothetical protein
LYIHKTLSWCDYPRNCVEFQAPGFYINLFLKYEKEKSSDHAVGSRMAQYTNSENFSYKLSRMS